MTLLHMEAKGLSHDLEGIVGIVGSANQSQWISLLRHFAVTRAKILPFSAFVT